MQQPKTAGWVKLDGYNPSEKMDLVAKKEKAIPIGMTFLLVREAGLEFDWAKHFFNKS